MSSARLEGATQFGGLMQIGNMEPTSVERNYGGFTCEERREARRERLIDAAIRVYGEVGYQNATVKAVCAAAGLTERYFYESFRNSEALLIAAYGAYSRRLLSRLEAIRAAHPGTAEERSLAVLQAYYQAFKDDPCGARLFVIEMARFGPAVDQEREALRREFGAFFMRTVAPDASAQPKDCQFVCAGAVGATLQILKRWIHTDYRASVDDLAAEALKFCRVLAEPLT